MANPPSCGIYLFRFLMLRMIKLLLSILRLLELDKSKPLKTALSFLFQSKGNS